MSGQAPLPSLDGENFTTKMVWIQLSRFDHDFAQNDGFTSFFA
jgi:hypothetical protein